MRKNNFYISFGIWLLILPFFGIPGAWKDLLMSLSGLFLILVASGPAILKKLQPKQKIKKVSKVDAPEVSPLSEEFKFSSAPQDKIEIEK